MAKTSNGLMLLLLKSLLHDVQKVFLMEQASLLMAA
jgi:hypothetical protein